MDAPNIAATIANLQEDKRVLQQSNSDIEGKLQELQQTLYQKDRQLKNNLDWIAALSKQNATIEHDDTVLRKEIEQLQELREQLRQEDLTRSSQIDELIEKLTEEDSNRRRIMELQAKLQAMLSNDCTKQGGAPVKHSGLHSDGTSLEMLAITAPRNKEIRATSEFKGLTSLEAQRPLGSATHMAHQ